VDTGYLVAYYDKDRNILFYEEPVDAQGDAVVRIAPGGTRTAILRDSIDIAGYEILMQGFPRLEQ
jgi:hypothetical protein